MKVDLARIRLEVESLPEFTEQIMLQSVDPTVPDYKTGCGRWSEDFPYVEADFKYPIFNIPYINELMAEFKMFRTRVMKLQSKRCYTYHMDATKRIHIPIYTNPSCFLLVDKVATHLEAGQLYVVDTTKPHTALNASMEERIHIVGCI